MVSIGRNRVCQFCHLQGYFHIHLRFLLVSDPILTSGARPANEDGRQKTRLPPPVGLSQLAHISRCCS
jgi:hypothetical protein